jgi:acyl transferase domain-containing protein
MEQHRALSDISSQQNEASCGSPGRGHSNLFERAKSFPEQVSPRAENARNYSRLLPPGNVVRCIPVSANARTAVTTRAIQNFSAISDNDVVNFAWTLAAVCYALSTCMGHGACTTGCVAHSHCFHKAA